MHIDAGERSEENIWLN